MSLALLCLHVEIVFALLILVFFVFGIVRKNKSSNFDLEVFNFAIFIIGAIFFLLQSFYADMVSFVTIGCFNCFVLTKFIILAKIFVLSVFGVFILIHFFVKDASCPYFEFVLLTLLSVLGGFFLLMVYDLMVLYLSLELQSLVLYVLPIVLCISGNFPREASFKYFIFGSIASSFILLGISFIYGFCGFTSFRELETFFKFDSIFGIEFRFLIGILFVFLGILFKMGIVPFHY